MARCDVHRLAADGMLVLDCQADVLRDLNTRVVAPLVEVDRAPPPLPRLHPVLDVAGKPHMLLMNQLSAVPTGILGPPVASLRDQEDAIAQALDMLLYGF